MFSPSLGSRLSPPLIPKNKWITAVIIVRMEITWIEDKKDIANLLDISRLSEIYAKREQLD
ncbi:MAG: hypothetical protein Fur0022_27260 [Anaerolineales bacterium]